ncbi:PIN3 [Candida pseudojiufengensis]|uniref:PIN3 n=1 Tax=Candida pseudojiufengensis TaxID=497109 RepID=UPI0022256C52|nr:PIN3 [Candida pseudojiufengensis]KAI5960991.1 PIN3 [Candida pseudojiufengensis]
MSAALVNRSLTTIRTELEFLKDSDVITDALYDQIVDSLPQKYSKDSKPKDVEEKAEIPKISKSEYSPSTQQNTNQSFKDQTNKIAEELSKTSLVVAPPAYEPQSSNKEPLALSYCVAIYDYKAQEADDLNLKKGEKLAIVEHLSEDWWKGYKSDDSSFKAGVFPSNYVKIISEDEFKNSRKALQPPQISLHNSYNSNYGPSTPYGQLQPQPSYGGYAQYPPPTSNYYPPSQPQQQQQQVQIIPGDQNQQVQQAQPSKGNERMKKYGERFGDGLAVGAGMGVASSIINGIF